MKQNHPLLSRLACLIGLGVILVAILALPEQLLWLESSLLMFWATISLIFVVRAFLFECEYFVGISLGVFFIGAWLLAGFIIWLGNMFLKLLLNPIFSLANWQFQIGNLFSYAWNYALSLPALICGASLFFIGILWNEDNKYHILKAAIMFLGSNKTIKTTIDHEEASELA